MDVATVNSICFVVIALAMIFLAIAMITIVSEVKRIREDLADFVRRVDQQITPIVSELRQIAEDVRTVTKTARFQLERLDSSLNFVSKSVVSLVDSFVKTVSSLQRGVLAPVDNVTALCKGISRGVEYFFRKK